jgi:hydroxymethylbilane synthase
VRLATRGSPLARWQAEWVADRLGQPVELVIVETTGDRNQHDSLAVIGGQGVFVKEVQLAVLEGRADAAVHSAKDLPSTTGEGLALAAIGERGDPRDALVGSTLAGLPQHATVATGSVRRRAFLAHLRPDLTFEELRGNMATRLAKAERYDAIVVAVAALERLGQSDRIAERLDPDLFVPQVGQGAIAVECRADDGATLAELKAIDHAPTRWAVEAERACLASFGTGCSLPIGAYGVFKEGLRAALADERGVHYQHGTGDDPVALGQLLASRLRGM